VEVREQASNTPIAKLRLQVRDRIGVVEFLEIDNSGRMFVLTENIPNNSKRPSAAFVVRYSPQGVQESIYDIPLQESVSLSRRFIAISPDGDVYFLRSRKTEVDVIGVGSRKVRSTAVIDNPNLPRFTEAETRITDKGPVAAVRPLTRQQVVQTAFGFEGLQWRLSPANYGSDPDTTCTGLTVSGAPVISAASSIRKCVVCLLLGVPRLAQPVPRQDRERMLAGNVCTHNDPRPDVTGVDCSAFVSAAWGSPITSRPPPYRRSRPSSPMPGICSPATRSTRRAATSCCFCVLRRIASRGDGILDRRV